MKATTNQLTELLKKLGLNVELVQNEEESTINHSEALDVIDNNRKPIYKASMEDEHYNAALGRSGGILRNLLAKTTGIEKKELEAIKDDEKAIKAALAFREEKYSQDTEELRKALDLSKQDYENAIEDLKQEHEKVLLAEKSRFNEREILDWYEKNVLGEITLSKNVDKKLLAKTALNFHRANVDIDYDESNGSPVFYKKGTKTVALSGDGKSAYDIKNEGLLFAKAVGSVEENMKAQSPEAATAAANALAAQAREQYAITGSMSMSGQGELSDLQSAIKSQFG